MYKYSDSSVKTMRSLLDFALDMLDSGMASVAGRSAEVEKQVYELTEKLFEAARERGCKSIDFNYLLVSDDGNYSEIMSFDTDQDAIKYVKGNFILFGSLRMTLDRALIYRKVEKGSEYYLAAAVKMSTRELVQYYPIGYWTSDQDEQQEAEQNENQSEDQTEDQTEDQSEDQSEDQTYLNVQTVYQFARLDVSFGFALHKLACIATYPDFTPDPLDQLAFVDGMLFGSLYALCFHSGHGQKTLHSDTFRVLRAQIARLHDLVLARIEV